MPGMIEQMSAAIRIISNPMRSFAVGRPTVLKMPHSFISQSEKVNTRACKNIQPKIIPVVTMSNDSRIIKKKICSGFTPTTLRVANSLRRDSKEIKRANGVSSDGLVIVGQSTTAMGRIVPFAI